jgi:hypothetical protein
MRGRTIRLSANRRLVIDAMRLSARVPTAAALRRMGAWHSGSRTHAVRRAAILGSTFR